MSEVSDLEKQLEDSKASIDRRDQALKLYRNPEFKRLILDEFCGTECARYAQLSADPSLNQEQRADALAMAQASGHLRRFLSVIVQMGNQAEGLMDRLTDEIQAAREEEQGDS